ncbi:MAG: sulfurtransferase [Candidatus Dactylopiibacterium carminicum]|nr:MAG: sulfurtransferase [Candidatus Dactylopiibacterium carminicum]
MDFFLQNIFLITLAIVSGLTLLLPILRGSGANSVTPSQAVMLINRQNAVLLDVREQAERDAQHVADSRHIPAGELPKRIEELSRLRSRPVIVLCDNGSRSQRAMGVLHKAGFEQVFKLSGGIRAWKDAGQPLSSAKTGAAA